MRWIVWPCLPMLLVGMLMPPQHASAEDRVLIKVAEWVRLKGLPKQTLPEILGNPLGLTTTSVKRLGLTDTDTDVRYAFDVSYDDDLVMTRRTKDFGVLWRLSNTGDIEKSIIFMPPRTAKVVSNDQYSVEFKDARKTLGDYVQAHH